MAHQEPGKIARPQVHADAVGIQRLRWALPVHRDQAGTTPLSLEAAHRDLRISPAEFDEVAAELGRTLDFVKVPKREKAEVLAAFAVHKDEVTADYVAVNKRS
jgi:hypothetical protein